MCTDQEENVNKPIFSPHRAEGEEFQIRSRKIIRARFLQIGHQKTLEEQQKVPGELINIPQRHH